ncbi:MAG: aspartate aminotransferase family protein [Treponema sp.]|jgi:4-aminobutyrate aminotransferase-like enzyme|nr:aspartate aminotransferase family protein [Treponema sp.]
MTNETGKKSGELREVPGRKSREIKKDLFQYEGGGTYWRATFDSADRIPVFEKQMDVRQWDIDGNEYIDTYGPFAASCLGHTPEKIIDAVYEQSKILMHVADMPNIPRAEFVKELAGIAPGEMIDNAVVHTEIGGSAAVELALQIAEYYTPHPQHGIISFYGAYHGRMSAGISATPCAYYREKIPTIRNDIIRIPFPYCYRCYYDKEHPSCDMYCLKAFREMFKSPEYGLYDPNTKTNLISTLIVEPAQFHGGGVYAPREYFKGIRQICDEFGIVFVDDEIAIGMGRTGKWWCIEHYGVTPDLITTSKALSGGVWPLSAVLGKREIMNAWQNHPDKHMGTWHGSAIGCKAATVTIREIKKLKLLDRVTEMGNYFKDSLEQLQRKHHLIGSVEGIGLGLGIELVRDRKTKEPADKETSFVVRRALEYGVLINLSSYYGNRMTFMPPYIIEKSDIDIVIEVLDKCFRETKTHE